jgi:tetratricopeptide (TPR) repeat protein
VTLDPNLTAAWVQLRALYEQQPGQLARQLEAAEKIVAQWPDDPDAFAGLARAYAQAGRRKEADTAWQRVRQLDPQSYAMLEADGRGEGEAAHEGDPLLQLFALHQQRAAMVSRWLMIELPGLPIGGWPGGLGGMAQLMLDR